MADFSHHMQDCNEDLSVVDYVNACLRFLQELQSLFRESPCEETARPLHEHMQYFDRLLCEHQEIARAPADAVLGKYRAMEKIHSESRIVFHKHLKSMEVQLQNVRKWTAETLDSAVAKSYVHFSSSSPSPSPSPSFSQGSLGKKSRPYIAWRLMKEKRILQEMETWISNFRVYERELERSLEIINEEYTIAAKVSDEELKSLDKWRDPLVEIWQDLIAMKREFPQLGYIRVVDGRVSLMLTNEDAGGLSGYEYLGDWIQV